MTFTWFGGKNTAINFAVFFVLLLTNWGFFGKMGAINGGIMSLISRMVAKALKSNSNLNDTDKQLETATAELNALQNKVANLNRNQGIYTVQNKTNRQNLIDYLMENYKDTIITFRDIVNSFSDAIYSLSKAYDVYVNAYAYGDEGKRKFRVGNVPKISNSPYMVSGLELTVINNSLFDVNEEYNFAVLVNGKAHNINCDEVSYEKAQEWKAEQIMDMPICLNLFNEECLFYFNLDNIEVQQLAVIAQAIENKVEKQKTGGTTSE